MPVQKSFTSYNADGIVPNNITGRTREFRCIGIVITQQKIKVVMQFVNKK